MKSSPFPGMDPYLEDRWPEVHARLIVYAANQINSGLPNDLQANIQENLAMYGDDHAGTSIRPDIHVLAAPLEEIPESQRTPYAVCVFRNTQPDQFEIYRAPLQQRLPNVPIPLRPGERDVVLELQPLIDACYRDGRYYRIDYKAGPKARFNEQDSDWISHRLRDAGYL